MLALADLAGKFGALDEREAGHFKTVGDQLVTLGQQVSGLRGTLGDQAEILASLDGVADAVADLTFRLNQIAPGDEGEGEESDRYEPVETIQWWALSAEDREAAIKPIRAWVDKVYRPTYGYLAAMLPDCWESHDYILTSLDWLMEVWGIFYRDSERTRSQLSGQAEFQTRYLPQAAELMAKEAKSCNHPRSAANGVRAAR
jgi:hypothetical protein